MCGERDSPERDRRASTILPEMYDELRALAAAQLARQKPGQTLQPTSLVHEAYMKLVQHGDPGWEREGHFFAAAAKVMRNILVDQARRKGTAKHGGDRVRIEFDEGRFEAMAGGHGMEQLDDALCKLEAEDPRKAELVTLRFFGGLSMKQSAEALGVSIATAERDWTYSKLWLRRELAGAAESDPRHDADGSGSG